MAGGAGVAVLALASTSARLMAETAARDGFDVIALDVFGDADTRRASLAWEPIGASARQGMTRGIDVSLTLAALDRLAQRGDVIGWVAGAGFEGHVELLRSGAQRLPLIGTAPDDVQRVRDWQVFFGFLDRHGIAHPEVRHDVPADAAAWLLKDSQGSGGWQVRRAVLGAGVTLPRHTYIQRQAAGVPMSATFIANGNASSNANGNADAARVLGVNRMLTQAIGDRPFVFAGIVGPLPLPEALAQRVSQMVQTLAAGLRLRGLCSLDFLLDRDRRDAPIQVLEVNPRPPASLGLYARRVAGGVMAAHVRACLDGVLPALAAADTGQVDGSLIVYAQRRFVCDARLAATLAAWPDAHDLPSAGACFDAGDPVCSLDASCGSADSVIRQLHIAREQVLAAIETSSRRQAA